MKIDLFFVIERLRRKRPVFVSEADLQLELAWTIKELYPDIDIRMEYCPAFDRRIHIDILLFSAEGCIPIELKYKTKGCSLLVGDESFVLANHSAKDVNCYLYLKDIQRIEKIKEKLPSFLEGYAIMITNDPSYLKAPSKANCVYADFSLHDGVTKHGIMNWGEKTGVGTKKGIESPILLQGTYPIHWHPYSKINDSTSGSFFFTCQRVV